MLATLPATAALHASDIKATLQMPAAGAGQTVATGDFTLLAWIHPTSLPGGSNQANILHIDNGLSLRLLSDGGVRASVMRSTQPQMLAATANAAVTVNEWALLAVSFDAGSGELKIWVRSDNTGLVSASAAQPGFTPGPVGNTLSIGAVGEAHAMVGLYGLIALRDHTVNQTDINDLWDHRRHHGPYSFANTDSGGSLSGPDDCIWMIGHAITTRPLDGGSGGSDVQRAAVVDEPVTLYNMHVYDTSASSFPTPPQGIRVARKVNATAGFVHRSPYDAPWDGFFVRSMPEMNGTLPGSPPHYVAGVSPKARLLATELPPGIGLVRVIASANSRGIQPGDGSAEGTGNFAHGFLLNNLHRTAGVINRPARLNPGPWFGYDCSQHNPYHTGTVTKLRHTDFSRFWTGQHSGSAPGPGEGVQLAPGASYALRCRPQGMIEADRPLIVQAHLLRFPGASDVQWVPNRHNRQGQAGMDVGAVKTKSLDTQTYAHVFSSTAGDEMLTDKRMALAGNHTSAVAVGDACYAGSGSLSIISAVLFDGSRTIIDFEHPFRTQPGNGATLRFGPWEFTTVWHHWPGLSAGDSSNWRGLRLTASGGGGQGVVVFSFDAWRPNVDGFAFGVAGWGGWGYEPQILQSFSGVIPAWTKQLGPDVWLQGFATQYTNVTWMDQYTARLRQGKSDVEIVWLGDIYHPQAWDNIAWHQWLLGHAAQNNAIGSTVLFSPDLGHQLDLFGDGLRSDLLHITERGNRRLAQLWTADLLQAAQPDPDGPLRIGDLNGDGVVDVSDLLILLGMWGICDNPNACAADLNSDGTVDVSDLLILLGNWG